MSQQARTANDVQSSPMQFSDPTPNVPLTIVHSTVAGTSIAAQVQASYSIGPVIDAALLRRGFNDTYEITCADGNRFIARLARRRARRAANLAYETALLVRLHEGGVIVPRPLRTRDGRLWHALEAPEGPRELVMFPMLEGRPASHSVKDCNAFGRVLASAHNVAEGLQVPSNSRLDEATLLERSADRLRGLKSHPVLLSVADQIILDLRGALEKSAPTLTRGVCHGDAHIGNAIVREDGRQLALLDFEEAGPGYISYDLATFLWGLRTSRPLGLGWTAALPWRAFLEGYRSARSILAPDRGAIGMFVALRSLVLLAEYTSQLEVWGREALPEVMVAKQLRLAKAAFGVTP